MLRAMVKQKCRTYLSHIYHEDYRLGTQNLPKLKTCMVRCKEETPAVLNIMNINSVLHGWTYCDTRQYFSLRYVMQSGYKPHPPDSSPSVSRYLALYTFIAAS